MATEARQFRTDASLRAEAVTRDEVRPMLERHGFTVIRDERITHGSAVTQIITARDRADNLLRMHVRLCWRRDGRNPSERDYSAAQLRARLIEGDWEKTLAHIANRERLDGNTYNLIVQYDQDKFAFAALIPSDQLPAIWQRQREVSANLIASGKTGRLKSNHAMNGASPTIWLQDDRNPITHAVPDALWSWPGVVNVLSLPLGAGREDPCDDTFDDLPVEDELLGRDEGKRALQVRSGYPRDPRVRAAVLHRAGGACEREGCGEKRDFPGFLDVHHILGVWSAPCCLSRQPHGEEEARPPNATGQGPQEARERPRRRLLGVGRGAAFRPWKARSLPHGTTIGHRRQRYFDTIIQERRCETIRHGSLRGICLVSGTSKPPAYIPKLPSKAS